MIKVPDEFKTRTIEREGDEGRAWIDALPGLVSALCERWNLALDGPVMHGYLGLVVPVRRGGELCALKVSWLSGPFLSEVAALRVWNGRGAVKLLDAEPSQGAMLLERLDYNRTLDNLPIREAIQIAGRLLRRLAVPAPEGFRSLRDWSVEIAGNLSERWLRYGRPMPQPVLDHARDLTAELGGACTSNLLVNYDLHYTDVLASAREPWLAVDPMAMTGDPEFGIAQLLWRRLEEMEAEGGLDRHFGILVDAAELNLQLARNWTLVRCVDYWLWGLSVGLTYDPARCERIIDWLITSERHRNALTRG